MTAASMKTFPKAILVLMSALMVTADASITVMDSGKQFPSRPDKKLGHQLWKESDYMGRLQFVHGNLQLCKSAQDPHHKFSITQTMDGLPVAIYAKAGGCPLEEKAHVASTLLDPPNTVGYLIVDDNKGKRRKNKKGKPLFYDAHQHEEDDESEEDDSLDDSIEYPFWAENNDTDEDFGSLLDELLAQVQKQPQLPYESKTLAPLDMEAGMVDDEEKIETAYLIEPLVTDDETAPPAPVKSPQAELDLLASGDDASGIDDEMVTLPLERYRVQSDENAWWRGGDEPQSDDGEALREYNRFLKRRGDKGRINVAILHVTNRVGYDILDLLLKENSEEGRRGGPKILLNSKEPKASARTLFIWTILSISVSVCACCCMLTFVELTREEETEAPQQPVRRRLTNNQVRENFPAFNYHCEDHVDKPLDDECAICLDDFTEGMRLRQLPCGHVFHSTCVARWLIERSAICPLCKMDLYESEEEEDEEVEEVEELPAARRPNIISMTSSWFSGSRPGTEVTSDTASHSVFSWLGWSENPGTTPVPATAPAPTPPPAQAFRWGFTRVPTSQGNEAQQATTPAPFDSSISSLPAWLSPSRWFPRRRRRGTEAGSMLTELTEPLMTNGGSGDEEAPTSSQEAEDTVVPSRDSAGQRLTAVEEVSPTPEGASSTTVEV